MDPYPQGGNWGKVAWNYGHHIPGNFKQTLHLSQHGALCCNMLHMYLYGFTIMHAMMYTVHINICSYSYTYTCTCIYTYTPIHICTCVCTYMYAFIPCHDPGPGLSGGPHAVSSVGEHAGSRVHRVAGPARTVGVSIIAVDSKKLEYGPGTIYAGVPSSLGFGVGGQQYSNFLASTLQIQTTVHLHFCAAVLLLVGATVQPNSLSTNCQYSGRMLFK